MKISARHDPSLIYQNERIVGCGVGLNTKRMGSLPQDIHRGPRDLRLAADAIGILHAAVPVAVAFADLRSVQDRTHQGRNLDLAPVTSERMNFRMQRRGRSHDRICRHR